MAGRTEKNKPEQTLEEQLAEKKRQDLKNYLKAIEEAGEKYKCGLAPSAYVDPNGVWKFQINPVNL